MKKIICIILITVTSILSGCNSTSDEEIISSQDFKENYEVSSYGTEEKINTFVSMMRNYVKQSKN